MPLAANWSMSFPFSSMAHHGFHPPKTFVTMRRLTFSTAAMPSPPFIAGKTTGADTPSVSAAATSTLSTGGNAAVKGISTPAAVSRPSVIIIKLPAVLFMVSPFISNRIRQNFLLHESNVIFPIDFANNPNGDIVEKMPIYCTIIIE